MNKTIFSILSLLALATAPLAAQAGQYQQRVITTTTILGATTGAVIGSGNNRTAQGAIIGGVIGAVTGAVLSQQHQVAYQPRVYAPQPRAHRPHRRHYTQVVFEPQRSAHRWHERYERRTHHVYRDVRREGYRQAGHRRGEWVERRHDRYDHDG